ncbi:MAG TPA: arylesterase [Novosphingobium sp.]
MPAPSESAPATEIALPPVMGPELQILAVGDSLFAGYGLDGQADSFPDRLEKALRSRGINARIANAGVSGDTSGAGAERFAFVLKSQPRKPDLVLLEFGGNDVLRAVPPEQTRANIARMLAEAKAQGVPVLLMGMLAPPNLGSDFKAKFEPIYPELAKQYGARLVPFFLAPVIGKPDLIQADHVHPNARGVDEIVAATVGQVAEVLPKQ